MPIDALDPGYFTREELLTLGFAKLGDNVLISRNSTIVGRQNISIGDNSRIDGNCQLIAVEGSLEIYRHVHIHSYCQIGSRGGVVFEDYSSLASMCLVYTASDDISGRFMIGGTLPVNCTRPKIAPVRFKRHAAAFARCTILPGVTMEEGAVACAHSLVSSSVPEWTIVAGAPAVHRLDRCKKLLTFGVAFEQIDTDAA